MEYLTSVYDNAGIRTKLTWIPDDNYNGLFPVTQACGFCFNNEGNVLVTQSSADKTSFKIPGGTIEPGETPEETLKREIDEETDVEIDDSSIIYIGAQKVEMRNSQPFYQLRFAAKTTKIKTLTEDPAKEKIRPRKFINPKDYERESGWGEIGRAMMERAEKAIGTQGHKGHFHD